MTRDHYKGARKRRAALINADGNLDALQVGGETKFIFGSAVLAAGTVTVSDSRFKATGIAFISAQHPHPVDDGLNWKLYDGSLTISGSSASTATVSYQVVI